MSLQCSIAKPTDAQSSKGRTPCNTTSQASAVLARSQEHQSGLARVPDFDDTCASRSSADGNAVRKRAARDRSVLDLLDADYTFVNERLASTTAFRNLTVRLPPRDGSERARRGLLGQGSMLLVTSNANALRPSSAAVDSRKYFG